MVRRESSNSQKKKTNMKKECKNTEHTNENRSLQ